MKIEPGVYHGYSDIVSDIPFETIDYFEYNFMGYHIICNRKKMKAVAIEKTTGKRRWTKISKWTNEELSFSPAFKL